MDKITYIPDMIGEKKRLSFPQTEQEMTYLKDSWQYEVCTNIFVPGYIGIMVTRQQQFVVFLLRQKTNLAIF